MDINQRKVTTTTTQSESMHMQDGEEPDLSLSIVGKTEREFVAEEVENLKPINKIVPIAVNSNSSQGTSISGVVSRKMKRDSVSKSTMIDLRSQGYKIIGSNILKSTLNEQKLQISENVNKRIGMCENLVLFCPSCKNDIYSFLTSPQVEKEKKKGMMDINLTSVAVVTFCNTFVCILTFLNHLLNIHTKVISSILKN